MTKIGSFTASFESLQLLGDSIELKLQCLMVDSRNYSVWYVLILGLFQMILTWKGKKQNKTCKGLFYGSLFFLSYFSYPAAQKNGQEGIA